ncbi:hypothetical protein Forpe1208_v016322 [Fusarium oxysporum f. sp. rapae]|uniref:Uncharacterized protein n=1 Tax=Fusarium oxysporum f. sp. rapae TaxID=485398 RepID=A0A8J5TPE1_FUSOX|nr:hypothetical protein Forpe1208_v016322 [Fusarium oxysporum f. sp. rapae]
MCLWPLKFLNPHRQDQSNPAHSPFNHIQRDKSGLPPPYASPSTQLSAQGHTQSCEVFSTWEKRGEASTNYTYEVWVLPKSCLGASAYEAQIRCLEHWSELQTIHESEVNVRCILHNPPSDSQDTELGVYKDIMHAKNLDMIYTSWNRRVCSATHVASTQRNPLTTIDDEISRIITFSQENPDVQLKKVKDELLPFLVATVAKSQEGWPLKEFLKRKGEIFDEGSLLQLHKFVALAAQFKLQSVSAFQASGERTSQALYTVNFLPDMVANATYDAIRGFFTPADMALKHKLKAGDKKGRSDSYCLKLVSFGAGDAAEGGALWQQWDDACHGDEDRTDHTFINAKRLLSEGPGPMLGQRIILAAAMSDLDRTSSKKRTDAGLYGDGTGLSFEDWKNCLACQNYEAVRSSSGKSRK